MKYTIKPKSRKEIYLAYLGGQKDLELPEPLTRDEINLYNICMNPSGGVTSWNDLTDKPFDKTTTVKEILPETKVESFYVEEEVVEDSYVVHFIPGEPGSINIPVGTHCTVTYNGVEYKATAEALDDGSVSLMNDGADLETGEGMVFGIMMLPEEAGEEYAGIAAVVQAFDGSTPETLAIRQEVAEIKTLDPEFVPRVKLTFTRQGSSEFTCDKTFDEVKALYDAGYDIVGVCDIPYEASGVVLISRAFFTVTSLLSSSAMDKDALCFVAFVIVGSTPYAYIATLRVDGGLMWNKLLT